MLKRILREPPFRLAGKAIARYFPCSFATKVYWEGLQRPEYAMGMFFAAQEAVLLGVGEILVAEFGVASGSGLLVMQTHAAAILREIGVRVSVVGFDLGTGLPAPLDYRDHPELWRTGDFPMNEAQLRRKLMPHTSLVLGDVAQTVPSFVAQQNVPLGFAAFDVDFYSSTMAALKVLSLPRRQILPRTPLYFDDVDLPYNHRFAGQLLAVDDFNRESPDVKVDVWHGLAPKCAFSDSRWIGKMYMAHDLTAASTQRKRVAVM